MCLKVGQLYKHAFFILELTVPCSKVKKTRCSQQEWWDLFSAATGVMGDRSLAMTFPTTRSKNIKPKVKITSFSSRHLPQLLKRLRVLGFAIERCGKGLEGCGVLYVLAGLLLAGVIGLPEVLTTLLQCVISDRREVDENCALLGCYAASSGDSSFYMGP